MIGVTARLKAIGDVGGHDKTRSTWKVCALEAERPDNTGGDALHRFTECCAGPISSGCSFGRLTQAVSGAESSFREDHGLAEDRSRSPHRWRLQHAGSFIRPGGSRIVWHRRIRGGSQVGRPELGSSLYLGTSAS